MEEKNQGQQYATSSPVQPLSWYDANPNGKWLDMSLPTLKSSQDLVDTLTGKSVGSLRIGPSIKEISTMPIVVEKVTSTQPSDDRQHQAQLDGQTIKDKL